MELTSDGACFHLRRRSLGTGDVPAGEIAAVLNYGIGPERCALPACEGRWELALDSADREWGGPGGRAPRSARSGDTLEVGPRSFVLYRRVDGE
jgi:hypothetical protein